ncbi:hypothetical protein L6R50_08980 [Myxococcota bacterium]|nr:hypothetical protein [Myxococcota bacterium]
MTGKYVHVGEAFRIRLLVGAATGREIAAAFDAMKTRSRVLEEKVERLERVAGEAASLADIALIRCDDFEVQQRALALRDVARASPVPAPAGEP